jgi:hypothetical protein
MKTVSKVLLPMAIAAASLAVSVPAVAEVSASAGVSNMYLWRGLDLGGTNGGVPAVYGEARYTQDGFYGALWGSSGDTAAGTEYDIGAGYAGETGGIRYDLSVWNYIYPSAEEPTLDDFKGLSEAILSVGTGPVTFTYYDNVSGGTGDEYYTLAGAYQAFTAKVGMHDFEADGADMTHLDLIYAFNDKIAFTLSQVVDEEVEGTYDDDMKFVFAYTLPIK